MPGSVSEPFEGEATAGMVGEWAYWPWEKEEGERWCKGALPRR